MRPGPTELPTLTHIHGTPVSQDRFTAMGSHFHLAISGGDAARLLVHARNRVAELEAAWSRFRPASDVCRLNDAGGSWVEVAADTAHLIAMAVRAAAVTDGLFDPTLHDHLVAAGYDRSFEQLARRPVGQVVPSADDRLGPSTASWEGIEVTDDRVRLPDGLRIDLGGIGKGHAADLVAAELVALGADGACVNAGGDVRVCGRPPGDAWAVGVEDPLDPVAGGLVLGLLDGGVATSSVLDRRWSTRAGTAHHLIDPRTGLPSTSDVLAATVVAADTTWAEVFAKCAIVAGAAAGLQLLDRHGLQARLTLTTAETVTTDDFERYLPWTTRSGGTSPGPAA